MVNVEINDLSTKATPESTDELEIQVTMGGDSNKVTAEALIQNAHGLGNSTVVGVSAGVLVSGTDVAVADGGTGASTAADARTNLGLAIGTDVQAYSAVLAATTASFTTADETKLDGIEALADVTDTANVTAAGALMDSEVDADLKTFSLPASTTISAFGATLVDDASASAARTTLGVDAAGTDNSTDVTLAGTGTYLSLLGQQITVDPITESDISDLGTYLENVSEDTSPTLGGALDAGGFDINNGGVIFLTEQAEAEVDVAGKGQIWVDTATPNILKFTDDAGTDFKLSGLTYSDVSGNDSGTDVTAAELEELTDASETTLHSHAGGGGLSNVVEDLTPQLGGSLDVNGQKIVSVTNGNIDIEPHGTGNVLLGNFTFDADQTVGAGQDNYVFTYDNATGLVSLEEAPGAGGGISNVVEDTTPQLGGSLDANGQTIDMNGLADGIILDLDGDTTISAPTDDQIDFELGGNDAVVFSQTAGASDFAGIDLTTPTNSSSLGIWLNADGTSSTVTFNMTGEGVGGAEFTFDGTLGAANMSGNLDLNGNNLILDADGDTALDNSADDSIGVRIAGAVDFDFSANQFTALSGSVIATNTISETTGGSGVTIDGLLIKDASVDLNGIGNLIIDADADTYIYSLGDDSIDFRLSGADDFKMTANTLTALSGSTIATNTIAETTAASGVTIDGLLIKDSKLATNNSVVTTNITDANVTSGKLIEAFFRGRQQSNTTNTAPTGMVCQWGWGFFPGTGVTFAEETITFPLAFSGTPYVITSGAGFKSGSDPTSQGDTGGAVGGATSSYNPTTTAVTIRYSQAGTFTSSTRVLYTWFAIGPA